MIMRVPAGNRKKSTKWPGVAHVYRLAKAAGSAGKADAEALIRMLDNMGDEHGAKYMRKAIKGIPDEVAPKYALDYQTRLSEEETP